MTSFKLRELYTAHINGMQKIVAEEERTGHQRELDGPHLMHCWDDLYEKAPFKLLLAGQEGGTVAGGASYNIEQQINGHSDFRLSTNPGNPKSIYRAPKTPFWKALWELNNTLNPSLAGEPCFLQTNVCKYSCDGTPIPLEDHLFTVEHLNLLPGEIQASKPHAVVFFSGPKYDEQLQAQFGHKLSFVPAIDGIAVNELARVIHKEDGVIPTNTYRTYHPRYLKLNNQGVSRWNYIQLIASLIKGVDVSGVMSKLALDAEELAQKHGLIMLPMGCLWKNYNGFYYSKPHWSNVVIGFEFESCGAGEFFFGIRRKDLAKEIPYRLIAELHARLGVIEGATQAWPWWNWFESPYRNFTHEAFEWINGGELKCKMSQKVEGLLGKLEGMEL